MLPIQRACIIQRLFIRPARHFRPIFKPCRRFQRAYATKSPSKDNSGPGFGKIFALAIVGTLIFNEAAKSLDKNKPKNTFTEDEYEHVMQGLKRRVALFPTGDLNVQFALFEDGDKLAKILGASGVFIDPKAILESCRTTENDPYEPLLNELHAKNGPDYINHLPEGLLVSLLGRYMKDHCVKGDNVVLLGFPHTIKDAIKFENEVSQVSRLLVPREALDSDICKYYETVHKSQQISL